MSIEFNLFWDNQGQAPVDGRAIEHRGYQIICKHQPLTGTDRIRRPDGSWRVSEPTVMDPDRHVWLVFAPGQDPEGEACVSTTTEYEAREWIDSRLENTNSPERKL